MIALGGTNIVKAFLGQTELANVAIGDELLLSSEEPLPEGVVKIEYLKSSGTQYTNTGILPDGTTKAELNGVFKYSAGTTRFGSRAGATSLQFDVITGSDNNIRIDLGTGTIAKSQWTVGQNVVSAIIIDASTKKAAIEYGGNIVTHTYTSSFPSQSSYPLTLFAFNNAGNILLASDMTVSSFRCWKSDALVMDMIPVRVGTTGYMYDKVSKTLFGNDGTGDFILGNDVT